MAIADNNKSPLLSIIIPTFNRSKYIERCLLSVFNEIDNDYPNTELIIIDGGSTDGTVEILKKYDHKITYWISESDSGVAEAINKGLAVAKGEFIRFLGDDDELIPGWFSKVVGYLLEHPEVDVLLAHGNYYVQSSAGELTPMQVNLPIGNLTFQHFLNIEKTGWPAPEMQFTRRAVFTNYGGYNTKYKYLGCLDMWLRHSKAGVRLQAIPLVIANRYYTPDSDNVKVASNMLQKEYHQILSAHGGILWKLTIHYPKQIKSTLMSPIIAACNLINVHPLRIKRRISAKLKSSLGINTVRS